jgi:phenylalanine-4-hydroxylase
MNSAPLENIPEHLREYITTQQPDLYTAIDHAAWRYIMSVSKAYFAEHAHPLYLAGLDATGISTERIPLVSEMDSALRRLGWRAVAINGFIPPSIFLEFQSLRILAIACDMRKLENLGYTPSPDIVHEAAGHAPIVADPGYRAYLEAYGEVARNAIISKYDLDLYEAILELSDLKEDPMSSPSQINFAQKRFEQVAAQETTASEAALLARMAWWTTEYGLVGSIEEPLIYGAGLLSSVDESYNCLRSEVKKIPFSLEATLKTSYDITRHQPQLFVAKNFQELTSALDQFANGMAFRKGGVFGLEVAKKAMNTSTVVLDNGLQLTGVVSTYSVNEAGEETEFVLSGNKQISFLHQASDAVPMKLVGSELLVPLFDKAVALATFEDIQRKIHGSGLTTKNGSRVQGRLKSEVKVGGLGRIYLLEQALVTNADGEVVFDEKTKITPLVLAQKVVSVFGGAADRKEFALRNVQRGKKVSEHKSNLTPENNVLNRLYQEVRTFRESGDEAVEELLPVVRQLTDDHKQDWLLRLELLQLFQRYSPEGVTAAHLRRQLSEITSAHPETKNLIKRGLEIL